MCLTHQGSLVATQMRAESEKITPILTAFPDKILSKTLSHCLLHHTPDLLPPHTFLPILFFKTGFSITRYGGRELLFRLLAQLYSEAQGGYVGSHSR